MRGNMTCMSSGSIRGRGSTVPLCLRENELKLDLTLLEVHDDAASYC